MIRNIFNSNVCLLLAIAFLLPFFSACSKNPEQSPETTSAAKDDRSVSQTKSTGQPLEKEVVIEQTPEQKTISDQPLEAFRGKLLGLAFDTAASLPIEPHIDTRSEWQQRVVDTCLKLGQPERAIRYADKIENWRRGLCYANLACYLAQNGYPAEQIQKGLDLAEKIAAFDYEQQWMSDEIRVAIAKVHLLLGQNGEVEKIESALDDPNTGAIASARAAKGTVDSFDKQVEILDGLIATGAFEAVKNALHAYTELYNLFYQDSEKRDVVENKIRSSWNTLPLFIRYELLTKLAEFSLKKKDSPKSLKIIGEMQDLIDAHDWPLQLRLLIQAKLSQLRFKAGDQQAAVLQADAALELFRKESGDRSRIVDIKKAEAIIPLAESYQAMGNRDKTLEVYKLAVKSAVENPNSRPRAEDLTDILCSMALNSVEPDEELDAEINRQIAGLGNPW